MYFLPMPEIDILYLVYSFKLNQLFLFLSLFYCSLHLPRTMNPPAVPVLPTQGSTKKHAVRLFLHSTISSEHRPSHKLHSELCTLYMSLTFNIESICIPKKHKILGNIEEIMS